MAILRELNNVSGIPWAATERAAVCIQKSITVPATAQVGDVIQAVALPANTHAVWGMVKISNPATGSSFTATLGTSADPDALTGTVNLTASAGTVVHSTGTSAQAYMASDGTIDLTITAATSVTSDAEVDIFVVAYDLRD